MTSTRTPAQAHRLDHARVHWKAWWNHRGPVPPPRPTPAMRTRMHEELDRLLTTGCSWCMAERLERLHGLLLHLQREEAGRRREQLLAAEDAHHDAAA